MKSRFSHSRWEMNPPREMKRNIDASGERFLFLSVFFFFGEWFFHRYFIFRSLSFDGKSGKLGCCLFSFEWGDRKKLLVFVLAAREMTKGGREMEFSRFLDPRLVFVDASVSLERCKIKRSFYSMTIRIFDQSLRRKFILPGQLLSSAKMKLFFSSDSKSSKFHDFVKLMPNSHEANLLFWLEISPVFLLYA